jgi:transposase-like protein
MDTSESGREDVACAAKRSWRRHSAEFKVRVIEMARQPGTSVAAVALANGLNANMLRRWVHEEAAGGGTSRTAASVRVFLRDGLDFRTPKDRAAVADTGRGHRGSAELLFAHDLKTAEGDYFNGHGRYTYGTLKLRRVGRRT